MPDEKSNPGPTGAEPKMVSEAGTTRDRIEERAEAQLQVAEKRSRLRQVAAGLRKRLRRSRRET